MLGTATALAARPRPPCFRCRAAPGADAFTEWLRANPLPRRHAGTAPGEADQGRPPPLPSPLEAERTERFHWTHAPAVAARCLDRHGESIWSMPRPGVLAAGSGSTHLQLELPRVLAGAHPALFSAGSSASSPDQASRRALLSPLTPRPEEESRQLAPALRRLAACAASAAEPGLGADASSGSCPELSIGSQLVVLLSADSAALGLFQEGQLARHRVLTGYTVRRQQGKAQATYERQGGGARSVGGSIRARETRRLFQGAAAVLADWGPDLQACNQLFRGGTVRAWNQLYASSDPSPPIDRKDPRWQPVGLGVRRPRLADLERVFAALAHGSVSEGSSGLLEGEE